MLDNALILIYQTLARHVPLKKRYPVIYTAFANVGLPMSGQEPWTEAQVMTTDILYMTVMEYILFCMIVANPMVTKSLVQLVVKRDSRCIETRLANDWYTQPVIPMIMQTITEKHYRGLKDNGELASRVSAFTFNEKSKELSVDELDVYPFVVLDMWVLASANYDQKSLTSIDVYTRDDTTMTELLLNDRFRAIFRDLFAKFMSSVVGLTTWSRAMQDIPGNLTQLSIHVCTIIALMSTGATASSRTEAESTHFLLSLLLLRPRLFMDIEKRVMNAYVAQLTSAYDGNRKTVVLLEPMKGVNNEFRTGHAGRTVRFRLRLHRVARVDELVRPHVYAFITHHTGAVVSRAPRPDHTMLELMYLRAPGVMIHIRNSDQAVEYELPVGDEDAAQRAGDELRIYFIVMYESTLEKTRTMIAPYQVEAHAHVRVSALERQSGEPILIPAVCGPTDSTLEFGPDESTTKPFGFVVDSVLELQNLGSRESRDSGESGDSTEVARKIQDILKIDKMTLWAQQRLLSGAHAHEHERTINASIHKQVMSIRKVSSVDQTLAYMSYPLEILDLLAVTYMRGPAIDATRFSRAVANALFAHRLGPHAFVGLVDYLEQSDCRDEWAFTLFKQIACQSLNFANMLIYRGDRLNGSDVDDMRNIRQTGFGDCEDMGECIYKDIETFLAMNDADFGLDFATLRLKHAIARHYVPCFTVMYVKYDGSPMHCVASLVPRRKFPTGERSAGDANIFRTIMFEGTNPVFPTFLSFADMNCPAMSETERNKTMKSVDAAIAVWEVIRKGDHSSGLVQTGFAAPKPPHQYRSGFYKGFVAVCARVDGKSGYYRFADSGGKMHAEGEPLKTVLEKDEFTLVDMSEGAAEANAYIEPYGVPCPMYTDAGTDMVLPHSALMNVAVERVKKLCTEYSTAMGSFETMSTFSATHLRMESVTMSYNMGCANPARGERAYDEMIAHLQEIMNNGEFKEKVTKLVPILDEVLPAIHILRIVCFLK